MYLNGRVVLKLDFPNPELLHLAVLSATLLSRSGTGLLDAQQRHGQTGCPLNGGQDSGTVQQRRVGKVSASEKNSSDYLCSSTEGRSPSRRRKDSILRRARWFAALCGHDACSANGDVFLLVLRLIKEGCCCSRHDQTFPLSVLSPLRSNVSFSFRTMSSLVVILFSFVRSTTLLPPP